MNRAEQIRERLRCLPVTRDEVETLIAREVDKRVVKICEFYLEQVPGYVATLVAEIMEAQGLTIKPPTAENHEDVQ